VLPSDATTPKTTHPSPARKPVRQPPLLWRTTPRGAKQSLHQHKYNIKKTHVFSSSPCDIQHVNTRTREAPALSMPSQNGGRSKIVCQMNEWPSTSSPTQASLVATLVVPTHALLVVVPSVSTQASLVATLVVPTHASVPLQSSPTPPMVATASSACTCRAAPTKWRSVDCLPSAGSPAEVSCLARPYDPILTRWPSRLCRRPSGTQNKRDPVRNQCFPNNT